MNKISTLKKEIINVGRLLWDKELVAACSGNISLKIDNRNILITTHGSCLGMLGQEDIVKINLHAKAGAGKRVTMEKPVHAIIHKNFPQAAVVHAHPAFTTGYFTVRNNLSCLTFESKLLLGDVPVVRQNTATITNLNRVVAALKKSKIVVLKRHGVISIGDTLSEAFFRIQLLEDAVKVNLSARIFSQT